MTKEEALQQKNLLEDMEDILRQYQELTQDMLLELEKIAPTNESKTKRRSGKTEPNRFGSTDNAFNIEVKLWRIILKNLKKENTTRE